MSHLTDSRFKSSNLILTLHNTFSNAEKLQPNAIFELEVTNSDKEKVTWTLDFKKSGSIYKGEAQSKPDVTIILSDDTLMDLADGKVCPNPFSSISFYSLSPDYRSKSLYDWKAQDEG